LWGAATYAVGTIESGQATSNAATYQAQVAQNNAIIAEQNANYASEAGLASAAATSMKGAAASGKVKATQAASGIDVNTGSAVNVQASERETNVLSSETVLNNTELQACGYRAKASEEAQAGLEKEGAEQATVGADIGATGNLLSSASSIGLKWLLGSGTNTPIGGTTSDPARIGSLY
jgi:hypothetical protein